MDPVRARVRPWAARRAAGLTALPVALLVGGAIVWSGTAALFAGSTSNPSNSLAAGTVNLSDDDSGSAAFSVSGLQRGDTGSKCITVTYGGTLTSAVRLYVSASSGTLGPYLTMTIQEGSGGSFASCSGFTSSSTIWSGTLYGLASASNQWSNGVGSWSPTGAAQTKVYKLTYTLSAGAPSSAQNTTAGATFTREARSS